jgi:hypothetical protein
VKELEPLMILKGNWLGTGQSPQGPYELDAIVEERGRWLLLRHAIKRPDTREVMYVSTQIYGFENDKLTLDYFDTAGSFKFSGNRTKDHIAFDWMSGDLWKKSEYWKEEDKSLRFKYQSMEPDPKSKELTLLVFEGTWTPADKAAA